MIVQHTDKILKQENVAKPLVLLTGAAGFIGREVLKILSDRNDLQVVPVYRENTNLRDVSTVLKCVEKVPNVVIDLAWSDLDDYHNSSHLGEQLPNRIEFYNGLNSVGVDKIVGVGTAAEYGVVEGCLSESFATIPHNAYAAAKDLLRRRLQDLGAESGQQWTWIRLFNVWGENQPSRTLYGKVCALKNDPYSRLKISTYTHKRDFLEVRDVAVKIVDIALSDRVSGVINCGSGKPIEIQEMIREWLRESKCLLDRIEWDDHDFPKSNPFSYWADVQKLQAIYRGF